MADTLDELIERLEKAEGPDRELDGAICLHFGWTLEKMKGDSRPYYRKPGQTLYYMRSDPPHYTGSLDDALALVGEKLGGKIGPIGLMIAGSGQCTIEQNDPCGWHVQAVGKTPPLAVLLALAQAIRRSAGLEG